MTKQDQTRIINELFDGAKRTLLTRVSAMPEGWDGFEIRRYVADYFAEQASMGHHAWLSRRNRYKHDIATIGGL